MLADDYNKQYINKKTKHTFLKNKLLEGILKSLENTPKYFFKALDNHPNKGNLNEDGLTQIFVIQNQRQILELNLPIYVGPQYIDNFRKTKGRPDIYFTISEEGKSHEPTFVMEAKRLPPPGNQREKEYVCGKTPSGNPNGGIERFKLEKHGIGLRECGLLGYIEADTPTIWLNKINLWISDLKPKWLTDEYLTLNFEDKYFSRFSSKCHRQNDTITLHHFWLYKNEQKIKS